MSGNTRRERQSFQPLIRLFNGPGRARYKGNKGFQDPHNFGVPQKVTSKPQETFYVGRLGLQQNLGLDEVLHPQIRPCNLALIFSNRWNDAGK